MRLSVSEIFVPRKDFIIGGFGPVTRGTQCGIILRAPADRMDRRGRHITPIVV